MALEMRVYKELSAIDPKFIAGMTGRQFLIVAVVVVVGVGVGVVLWLAGLASWIEWLAVVLAVPAALFGWVKPLGMRCEVWLGQVGAYLLQPKRLVYREDPVWRCEHEERKKRNARQARITEADEAEDATEAFVEGSAVV